MKIDQPLDCGEAAPAANARQTWVRPSLRRLVAATAELNSGGGTDSNEGLS